MTHSRKKREVDMVAFRADVEAGEKQVGLCKKYGISTSTVARLRAEISGKLPREIPTEGEAEAETPEAFDLTINVPADRLDDLISAGDIGLDELRRACLQLAPQSKAELFQEILQGRLNRALLPIAVELPKLVGV